MGSSLSREQGAAFERGWRQFSEWHFKAMYYMVDHNQHEAVRQLKDAMSATMARSKSPPKSPPKPTETE